MYTGKDYPLYFKTPHWQKLKEDLIYSNPNAKCWICGKKNTLLLHHVSYSNLLHELLNRDVFIVCFNCHTRIHFPYFSKKTPLIEKKLRQRMVFLRYTRYVREFRLGSLINKIGFAAS